MMQQHSRRSEQHLVSNSAHRTEIRLLPLFIIKLKNDIKLQPRVRKCLSIYYLQFPKGDFHKKKC